MQMEPSDAELVGLYKNGDQQALERLVLKYRRMLFGFILGMLNRQEDAEELYQEVWFKVIRNLNRYQDRNFFGWLVQIARNGAVDRLRRRRPDLSLDVETEEGGSLGATIAGTQLDPAAQLAARDLGRRIAAAVAELPQEQREVFLMRTSLELPFKEIARLQKVSINTALARMQYALGKLRGILKREYGELGRSG